MPRVAKLLLISAMMFLPNLPSYGHLYGYNVQEWTNQKFDILIQFDTDPQTPSVGKNATLNFSVQNLQTEEHLKNFTAAITIIYYGGSGNASSNIVYKSNSRQIADGDFSQSYVFTNGGTYEVFLRVDTPTLINVSKFTVFVSSPQFQIVNMVYLFLPFAAIIGVFAVVSVLAIRHLYKKR